ncbi:hypothetical protein [Sphingobacterium sp. UBA7625]|uniref:hypothetical protein n=1 Tax=Sphingobacterium sp. UBA7625 TaxID=1947522 RepID=UPI00257E68B6|nr:hypothetical protein [Sphingobacterium sp. UBA7625]
MNTVKHIGKNIESPELQVPSFSMVAILSLGTFIILIAAQSLAFDMTHSLFAAIITTLSERKGVAADRRRYSRSYVLNYHQLFAYNN